MEKSLRHIFLLSLLASVLLCSCSKDRQFAVEGTVENAEDSVLFFERLTLSGIETIDSLRLSSEGRFRFTAKSPEAPDFFQLRIAGQIIPLSIDSTETVEVKARCPQFATAYSVSGSVNCERIRLLSLMQLQLRSQAIDVERSLSLTPRQKQDSIEAMIRTHKRLVAATYIFAAPEQASSYYALFQTIGPWLIFDPKSSQEDSKVFAAVATSWDTFYPNALRTQNLHNIALESVNNSHILRQRQNAGLDASQIDVSGIIDVSLTDNRGQTRQLSELAGRVVLLDFHSFRLDDSPQRILYLRDLYNKYHARGLEIFQIALDDDTHFWQQKTEHLPWICVIDPTGETAVRYNVTSLPELFTIDRSLTLQHRSSQIEDLEKEILSLL